MGILKNTIKRGLNYVLHGVPVKNITVSVSYTMPNERLAGKKIIVTGGAGGLGFAMAKKFKSEKAEVLIAGRNIVKLKEKAKEIGCKYLSLDVQNTNSFVDFLQEATVMIGPIDCLVNNAGVSLHEGGFMKVTTESFDTQMDTNLRGSYFLSQEFIKYIECNHIANANILFITSEKGIFVDNMPYGLTKWALNSLTQALANEYIQKGIRINAIAPGVTTSEMTGYKADGNLYAPFQINRRLYLPEEVAEIACFLLSDVSKCLSGQIIACNEGKTVNRPLEIKVFNS